MVPDIAEKAKLAKQGRLKALVHVPNHRPTPKTPDAPGKVYETGKCDRCHDLPTLNCDCCQLGTPGQHAKWNPR